MSSTEFGRGTAARSRVRSQYGLLGFVAHRKHAVPAPGICHAYALPKLCGHSRVVVPQHASMLCIQVLTPCMAVPRQYRHRVQAYYAAVKQKPKMVPLNCPHVSILSALLCAVMSGERVVCYEVLLSIKRLLGKFGCVLEHALLSYQSLCSGQRVSSYFMCGTDTAFRPTCCVEHATLRVDHHFCDHRTYLRGVVLSACYAVSGTDVFRPTYLLRRVRYCLGVLVSSYEPATPCP
eukprot:964964-Rhodomonas_salina.1